VGAASGFSAALVGTAILLRRARARQG